MALPLYIATTIALLLIWDRCIDRVPRAIAVALVLMPMLFVGRALLTNQTVAPADMPFMAEPLRSFANDFGVRVPESGLSDLHCQIIPWQRAVRHSLANGEWPLWNPFILSGDILAAAAQPAVYDPFQWIGMLIPLVDAFTFNTALTFFLAGFFAWAFARTHGMSDIAALVVAAGFMFCGMLAFFAGWPLGRAWSYLPLVLFATRRVVHEEKAGLLALAFVLVIVSGHPESVLHIVAVSAAYGAFEWMRVRKARPVLLAIAAGITALLLTAVYLLPFFEAVPQTIETVVREEMYATQSYDVLAKPDVRMDRIRRTFVPYFRGTEPLTARVGPVVLALAVIGLIARWRRRETWFFAALALVCYFATWGMWPIAHALHELPLFDIAINERLAFAAAFAVAMLAGFGVDAVRPGASGGRGHGPRTPLAGLASATQLRQYPQDVAEARPASGSGPAARPPEAPRLIALITIAILLAQRVSEDGSFYAAHPRETFFPRVPLIAAIPRDARMLGVGFTFTGNNPTMYGLEDVRGYQAMTNRRYYETYTMWSHYQTAWYNRVDDLSRPFLSFLNVGYALAQPDQGDPPEGWRVVAEVRGTRLYENLHHLPRAFVPRRIRYEREGKATLAGMQSATDFGDIAWIEAPEYEPHQIDNGRGHVTLQRTGLAYELDVSMENDGWVVVSATAWKGWRARIDGHRVEPRFANHAFLGIFVPRGTHRVTLDYLPKGFTRGRTITLLTIAGSIAYFALRRYRAKQPRAVSV